MNTIHAHSIGIPLAEFFRKGETSARVIARYEATLQLQSDDVWWAITTQDNAGAYRIAATALPTWSMNTVVRVSEGVASSDEEAAQWDERAWWNPSPRQRTLNETERALAAQRIASALSEWVWAEALGLWDELAEQWASLCASLYRCDEAMLHACVTRLLGRGAGLTPTGDDVLQALLVTLRTGDTRDQQTCALLKRIVASTLSRTTPLSQSFLREAMQGWAFGPLKTMLDDLPTVSENNLGPLLQVGASSGLAYGCGVLLGLAYRGRTSQVFRVVPLRG
jgi:hypothetical protein